MDISFLQQAFEEVSFNTPTLGVVIASLLAVVLLGASAFASGSEIAFFSLTPSDLNEMDTEKNPKDLGIDKLRKDSERTLATILVANNFVNVTIIMLCNYVFGALIDFGNAYWSQVVGSLGCIAVLPSCRGWCLGGKKDVLADRKHIVEKSCACRQSFAEGKSCSER